MTGNHQLDSLIAAILIGGSFAVLYAGCIFIYRIFFTRSHDDYPIKYYAKISKKTKGKDKSREDMDAGTDQYAEIINDYPTYNRQELK